MLAIDEAFGNKAFLKIKEYIEAFRPDSAVLYSGGNVLRPEEMFSRTVLVDVPRYIAANETCKAYELEARIDDVLSFRDNLIEIKKNLRGKKLRLRLGIEFFDDGLLERHQKGITRKQIVEAVDFLNGSGIEWNGYVLFGGLDLKREDAINVAIRTAEFMIKNGAFKVSINGTFTTQSIERKFGKRIYVPDYRDLVCVLKSACECRDKIKSMVVFKTGFREEDMENMVRIPYVSDNVDLEKILEKLEKFDLTQDPKALV